jgi:pimeloyl-ACP methyl ester carboxylesterase
MRISAWLGVIAAAVWIGCDGDEQADPDAGQPALEGPIALEVDCNDPIDAIYEDASTLPGGPGDVLRCAPDGELGRSELQARLESHGWSAREVTSAVRVYRVLYRTERGDPAGSPGTSSALVLLPDTPRAAELPAVVASHGSHGQCETCAPSMADPVTQTVRDDFERQVYSLAGYGYAVIAPDLAGYADYGAAGNPPPSYGASEDVGKSTLDGARALRGLIPSALTEQVVLVGHSQGGHTALSALAIADSYGSGGSMAAVALYAPLWLTQRSWGAVTAFPGLFPFEGSEGTNAVAIWYHYTRAELVDGAGHGGDVFRADQREPIAEFVNSASWGGTGWDKLHALGETAADVFAPEFTMAVGSVAAGTAPSCPNDGDPKALCERWMARYAEDRPHLPAPATEVPILLAWGAMDTTIGPDRITCAIDRLRSDDASLTVCVEPGADHGGILATKADHMADWIAARTLSAAEPTACAADEQAIVDQNGMPASCNPLPPND